MHVSVQDKADDLRLRNFIGLEYYFQNQKYYFIVSIFNGTALQKVLQTSYFSMFTILSLTLQCVINLVSILVTSKS